MDVNKYKKQTKEELILNLIESEEEIKFLKSVMNRYEEFLKDIGAEITRNYDERLESFTGAFELTKDDEIPTRFIHTTTISLYTQFLTHRTTKLKNRINELLYLGDRKDLLEDEVKMFHGRKVIFLD